MFDYTTWINWRKAYHDARKVYHQEMGEFYQSQIDLTIKSQKLITDFWVNVISFQGLIPSMMKLPMPWEIFKK